MENSERLGRQARPRIEPGTSRLQVFEHSHRWGQGRTVWHPNLTRDLNPGSLVLQPASLATTPLGRREHIWKDYEFRIWKQTTSSKQQLKSVIQDEWNKISLKVTNNLVQFMPNGISGVLKSRGNSTKH